MHLFSILLFIFLYLLFVFAFARSREYKSILDMFVKGHVIIFTFIAISTEFLSFFHAISFNTLVTAWLTFSLFLGGIFAWAISKRNNCAHLRQKITFTPLLVITLGSVGVILVATFLTAILYPPNNWDSMTYHMARVAHWINNKSISFYPTGIIRQNYQMPLAEFAIMHLQLLTGSDVYANLVQWVNFLALIFLAPLVASELKLSDEQQLLSALVVATLPMGILQASSTQNDVVVSTFVMSFCLFMLRCRRVINFENIFFSAISLGIALLTKGTAYIYCAAVGLTLSLPVLFFCRSDLRRLSKYIGVLLLIVSLALALNAGHLWRNYNLYGNPLSTEGEAYHNTDFSFSTLGSNIIRNAALHLGTSSAVLNSYVLKSIHFILGEKINDPKTTWEGTVFEIPYNRHEDISGNILHLLILVFGLISLPYLWRQYVNKSIGWYSASLIVAVIFYCCYLKWQPWGSRLQTPLFVLAAPLIAMTIFPNNKDIGPLRLIIPLILAIYGFQFALNNQSRSLLSFDWWDKSRLELYFQNKKFLYKEYLDAVDAIPEENDKKVGLYLREDDWEYPLWVLMRRKLKNGQSIDFEHLGVSNISKNISSDTIFLPKYIIATTALDPSRYGIKYSLLYESEYVKIYYRKVGG